MSTENKNKYETYFDEEPTDKKKDTKFTKQKNDDFYKMPKPKIKKTKNKTEPNEMNIDDYNLVNEDDDFLDLKNELNIEYLEEKGYKLVPLDQVKNLLLENDQIQTEEINLSPDNEIATLEEYLRSHPCDYNCLVKLIDLYWSCDIKDKLKEIRVYTQNLFPLSQEMWLDWISDEFEIIQKDDLDKLFNFKEMYQKSISDFLYLKLCKKYLKYLITLLSEVETKGLEEKYNFSFLNVRQVFEEILEIWGLDLNNSSKIWDLYLNFEINNSKKFSSSNNDIEVSKTILLIRSIYRRRLSFPHVDMDIVWIEYNKWETDDEERVKVKKKYNEASQKVSNFINFEEKLTDMLSHTHKENNSIQLREFLNKELPILANKNFNYIRLFYERTLQMNPDDEDIWDNFIAYAHNKDFKIPHTVYLKILQRACKCCYFKVTFWIVLLREMEKQGSDKEEIEKKISEAYISAENDRSKYEIWKYSLEFNCRNFNGTNESLNTARADFEKCVSQVIGFENNEFILKIYMIWSEFETYKAKDFDKMKEIMEKVIRICEGDQYYWNCYIQYLKSFNLTKDIRSIYKRATEYVKDEKVTFSQHWIAWEKIFGTASEIENALIQSKKIKAKEKNKTKVVRLNKKKNLQTNKQCDELYNDKLCHDENIESNKENQNIKEEVNYEYLPQKINKKNELLEKCQEEIDDEKENDNNTDEKTTVFINNIPLNITDDDLHNFIVNNIKKINILECRIVKDKAGKSRGFAFVDFPNIPNANKCVKAINKKTFNQYEISCAISKPPSTGENDTRTIFVNNLPFSIDESMVSEVFSKCGDILDIRIIRDKITLKPKGYCYVEFQKEESVLEAMKLTDLRIGGRKVILKKSESDVKMREKLQHVVYLTNLSYETTEVDLEGFFTNNGINNIREIHIVKDEDGSSKGFAFIQFEDEENMKNALKFTGKLLNNRAITIKISKRNITKKRESDLNLEEELKHHKRKKFDNKPKNLSKEPECNANDINKEKKAWSNQDFQNLLMNKK